MTLPDDKLTWHAVRTHDDCGEIDWTECEIVEKENGPCNKQRLEARRKAHEEGQWVREAAMAHTEKRQAKTKAA